MDITTQQAILQDEEDVALNTMTPRTRHKPGKRPAQEVVDQAMEVSALSGKKIPQDVLADQSKLLEWAVEQQVREAAPLFPEKLDAAKFGEDYVRVLDELKAAHLKDAPATDVQRVRSQTLHDELTKRGVEVAAPNPKSFNESTAWLQALREQGFDPAAPIAQRKKEQQVQLEQEQAAADKSENDADAPKAPVAPIVSFDAADQSLGGYRCVEKKNKAGEVEKHWKSESLLKFGTAFIETGDALKTGKHDAATIEVMLSRATQLGWASVDVAGAPEFCRNAFLEGAKRGIQVNGYTPTPADLEWLRKEGVKAQQKLAGPNTMSPGM